MEYPALKSELELFSPPITQVTMESAYWSEIHPSNSTTNSSQFEFFIAGSDNYYLDLNDTSLWLRIHVEKPTGAEAANYQYFENMIATSLFQSVSIYLNDVLVEGAHDMYPYKAMLTSLLQFDKSVKQTQLRAAGFANEDDSRKAWMEDKKTLDFMTPLYLDFCCQSKYLLPKVNVKIVFTMGNKRFFTRKQGKDWTITVQQALMFVRRVKVLPSVLLAHELGLKKNNAIYPIKMTNLYTQTIPTGSRTFHQDHIFRGHSPKLLIVALVKSSAFAGDFTQNPFKFEHFNLNHLLLTRDGEPVPFARPFTPNFADGLCVREYMSMFQCMEMFMKNESNGITLDEFKDGKTIFVFNLCADLDMNTGQPHKTGNLRVDIQFSEATTAAINVIFMSIGDSHIEVDSNRRVHLAR